jgi:hypothetical protein
MYFCMRTIIQSIMAVLTMGVLGTDFHHGFHCGVMVADHLPTLVKITSWILFSEWWIGYGTSVFSVEGQLSVAYWTVKYICICQLSNLFLAVYTERYISRIESWTLRLYIYHYTFWPVWSSVCTITSCLLYIFFVTDQSNVGSKLFFWIYTPLDT